MSTDIADKLTDYLRQRGIISEADTLIYQASPNTVAGFSILDNRAFACEIMIEDKTGNENIKQLEEITAALDKLHPAAAVEVHMLRDEWGLNLQPTGLEAALDAALVPPARSKDDVPLIDEDRAKRVRDFGIVIFDKTGVQVVNSELFNPNENGFPSKAVITIATELDAAELQQALQQAFGQFNAMTGKSGLQEITGAGNFLVGVHTAQAGQLELVLINDSIFSVTLLEESQAIISTAMSKFGQATQVEQAPEPVSWIPANEAEVHDAGNGKLEVHITNETYVSTNTLIKSATAIQEALVTSAERDTVEIDVVAPKKGGELAQIMAALGSAGGAYAMPYKALLKEFAYQEGGLLNQPDEVVAEAFNRLKAEGKGPFVPADMHVVALGDDTNAREKDKDINNSRRGGA